MSYNQSFTTESKMPPEFLEEVKQALENLYDFGELQRLPLAQALHEAQEDSKQPPAHQLRRELIAAIESLNPGVSVSVRAGSARIYNLMHLHCVGGMTLQETAYELGISVRQGYRDLRRGQESVAQIIWYKVQQTQQQEPDDLNASDLTSLQSEVERLKDDFYLTNLTTMLHTALGAVQRLASQRGLTIETNLPHEPVMVSANPTMAQQVLISLLSKAVQTTTGRRLDLSVSDSLGYVRIGIAGMQAENEDSLQLVSPVIERLIEQLGWQYQQVFSPEMRFTLQIYQSGSTILIIDDNDGLVDLLKRYFTGYAFRVLAATSGGDGLRLALETVPDAIIMDLMMPGMDGWELLQRLRTHETTRDIPVIICSVINDPELAYSLGASKFVAKPVNKETVMQALHDLAID